MGPELSPPVTDLVLVGGGHSHVQVLKALGMAPLDGVRVTVVAREAHTPYSGMLPGFIAGHYEWDDIHIDLGPLCRFAGARLIVDAVTELDLENNAVHCANRPPVRFDTLSINCGAVPEAFGASGVPVKPIGRFLPEWQRFRETARPGMRILFVGGGAGGVELALAARNALPKGVEIGIVTAELLPGHGRRARRMLADELGKAGVELRFGSVAAAREDELALADGTALAFDRLFWVTGVEAPGWVRESALAADARGFARVDACLRSLSHPRVFVSGDVACLDGQERPKSGVIAVRAGPVLAANLRRALEGRRLRRFRPQKRFLSIVGTGDGRAVAARSGVARLSHRHAAAAVDALGTAGHIPSSGLDESSSAPGAPSGSDGQAGGRRFLQRRIRNAPATRIAEIFGPAVRGVWVWRWKERIDRRFMERFQKLPDMPGASTASNPASNSDQQGGSPFDPMRCGGCGAKLAAGPLHRVLSRLPQQQHADLLQGIGDDAAVLRGQPEPLLLTLDGFRSLVDDPYLFGRITAHHSLNDIYAMGAVPTSALAIATVPLMAEAMMEEELYALLRGAVDVLNGDGVPLVGGHSSEGSELSLGLAVTGKASEPLLTKAGCAPGDRLLLTKPLGIGVLLAAHMRGQAPTRFLAAAVEVMDRSNREALEILRTFGVRALTDVTGFGLLGHLGEMLRASGSGAELWLDAVPTLQGAQESFAGGAASVLQAGNEQAFADFELRGCALNDPALRLLADPQTSGGLLASVPADRTEACLEALIAAGYPGSAIIGAITSANCLVRKQEPG